ncbi:hypothetical protein WR25_02183 [Diploscapter pachys]|uniref:Protein quiver n=1 Tax=Diploscapter pachys TaxID=2018661 RepID=A0A2A2KQP0_9BILA|nr:hypothetical protein WR25_02183 [Diploscapter pachys]
MGSCQSSHCYIEKKPTETPGAMKITKGCIRHSPRLHAGCEYDNFADHVLCTCKGRFCNDIVALRRLHYRNVTCRMCTEKDGSDCDDTCTGQWCFEDSTTGVSGCGFGPPSLPFFYKGYQLFYYTNKVCIMLSRGAGKPRRHCICNTSMCNSPNSYFYSMPDTVERYSIKDPKYLRRAGHNSMRSLAIPSTEILALQTCYNCELNSQDASVTSSCKQNRCLGHFCTYVSQRTYASAQNRAGNLQSISERQGCMNVSDSTQVQLGCFRKWMHNEFEEVVCACKGDLCNRDDLSAFGFKTHSTLSLLVSVFAFCVFLSF